MNAITRISQINVAQVTQHPYRHLAVVIVLDFQMQDKGIALDRGHFGDQISAAIFDPLSFGREQFGIHQFQLEQINRHLIRKILQPAVL